MTTVTKPITKERNKRDRYLPFTHAKEAFILTGTETPEQFVIWWKEYIDKVKKREGLTHDDKIDILKRVVKDTAKKTFHLTMEQTGHGSR